MVSKNVKIIVGDTDLGYHVKSIVIPSNPDYSRFVSTEDSNPQLPDEICFPELPDSIEVE